MGLAKTRAKSTRAAIFLLATGFVGGAVLLPASPSRAGSIFNDDYAPPKRVEPAPQPSPEPAPAPATQSNTPTHVPAPAVHTDAPAKPAEGAAGHHTVPDKASRAKCRTLFEEVYAKELKDQSPGARRALAQTLLSEAQKNTEGSPDRFVLLNGAIQAGAEAPSLRISFTAANQLAKGYDVDELAVEAEAAGKAYAVVLTPGHSSISNIEALLSLGDQLVAEGDFAALAQVETSLQRAMPGIADADLKLEVRNQIHDVATLRETRDKVAPASEKLKKSPDDPPANLAIGSYLCFQRGQWEKGLPLLAKSSDTQLKDLAKAELSRPTGSDDIGKLGDKWFAAASKFSAAGRTKALQHAGDLYRRAVTGMAGLQAMAIEKRLEQIPPNRLRRIDLLELFDPAVDIVRGTWAMKDGVLNVDADERARVEFPYEPPDEYDFRVTATPGKGGDGLCQFCYHSGHQFMFVFGGWGNTISAFERVNGTGGPDNKTAKRKDHWVSSGQHYTIVVKVRRTGVEAYVDGQLITGLKTDYSDMDLDGGWQLPHGNTVGLAALNSAKYDSVEIIEITGEGKMLAR